MGSVFFIMARGMFSYVVDLIVILERAYLKEFEVEEEENLH